MRTLTRFILDHRRAVLALWALLLACAIPLCLRLPDVVQGATETIAGTESDHVNQALQRAFGDGAPFTVPVVVQSSTANHQDPAFRSEIDALDRGLGAIPEVRSTRHFWNSRDALLLGRDGHSALILVQTTAASIGEAENFTAVIRNGIAPVELPTGFAVSVTGTAAMFHDLNRNSSSDLWKAEIVGVPLTLLILLLVFRSPLAAALPLLVAGAAAMLTLAGLYLLSAVFPVSVFAQNAVTMIGLGAGVDYALFVVHRFRAELARGAPVARAVVESSAAVGPAVLVSGIAVGIGFLALLLVNASFLRSLAIGGLLVIGCAVATSLTLLPLALYFIGNRVNWPFASEPRRQQAPEDAPRWNAWARRVMAHPWAHLLPALAVISALALPVFRMNAWNVGVTDLPAQLEARRGYEVLQKNFAAGWMGPIAVVLEAAPGGNLWDATHQDAALAVAARIARDTHVAEVDGYPRLLAALGAQRQSVRRSEDLPAALQESARQVVSARADAALLLVLLKQPPDARDAIEFVKRLRDDRWPEARASGMTVSVGGPSAMMVDFDAELLGSLWRVVPAVLVVTFIALVVFFRSILVPLKAILANLASVLAAYGFLVLVFQDGVGAGVLAIEPPGGLNSFIVLMLFTILFGLSMDYEVFLLRCIQEERARTGTNDAAVAAGLASSAGLITSAAAVMVCLFASFGLTELSATRQFGLGLAFAVALDATIIRLLIVPALMKLLGEANWWFPGSARPQPTARPRQLGART